MLLCDQVDANPTTVWLYKDLSLELGQLHQIHPRDAKTAQGMSASVHCQLLLLQANAHHCLSKQPGGTNRSASCNQVASSCCCVVWRLAAVALVGLGYITHVWASTQAADCKLDRLLSQSWSVVGDTAANEQSVPSVMEAMRTEVQKTNPLSQALRCTFTPSCHKPSSHEDKPLLIC